MKTDFNRWYNTLSCKAIREIIDKRKTQELSSRELYATFEHSMRCSECRDINMAVLDMQIEKAMKGIEEK